MMKSLDKSSKLESQEEINKIKAWDLERQSSLALSKEEIDKSHLEVQNLKQLLKEEKSKISILDKSFAEKESLFKRK